MCLVGIGLCDGVSQFVPSPPSDSVNCICTALPLTNPSMWSTQCFCELSVEQCHHLCHLQNISDGVKFTVVLLKTHAF